MRQNKINNVFIRRIIKDFVISILFFTVFSFIDLRSALFISILCFSILVSRRIILDLNPGFIKGHRIYNKEKEMKVPGGVDVFEVGNASSISNLFRYVEVISNILVPPRIMILRFSNKFQLDQFETDRLYQIINRLKMRKISIIFSDVNANMQNQLRQNNIAEKIREENIFYYIKDALKHATEVLKSNQMS